MTMQRESNKALCLQLIEALGKVYSYASVLATNVTGKQFAGDFTTTSVRDSKICENGFVVRVFNGVNYSEYSFNEFREDNFDEILKEIKDTAEEELAYLKKTDLPFIELPVIKEEEIKAEFKGEYRIDPDSISVEDKIAKIRSVIQECKLSSDELINMNFAYDEVNVYKAFYSTKKQLEQEYKLCMFGLVAIVRRGNNVKYDHTGASGRMGYEIMEQALPEALALVKRAVELLDSTNVEPGVYEVICDPDVSGLIAHEAFGHGVEMDMFVKNRAKGADYLQKEIASAITNMTDGAAVFEQVASYYFDDEGVLASRTAIIKDGILENGISDLVSAMQLGTTPTGNGRRESFERKAYARMTNTYFEAGTSAKEEMISSIAKGYLLENYSSGMEDPKNWGIQCVVLRGREIVDGKLTGRIVSPIMISGYVPELLGNISMVSDGEVALNGLGFCGKGYKEWVKTSIGGTYIKTKARLG